VGFVVLGIVDFTGSKSGLPLGCLCRLDVGPNMAGEPEMIEGILSRPAGFFLPSNLVGLYGWGSLYSLFSRVGRWVFCSPGFQFSFYIVEGMHPSRGNQGHGRRLISGCILVWFALDGSEGGKA